MESANSSQAATNLLSLVKRIKQSEVFICSRALHALAKLGERGAGTIQGILATAKDETVMDIVRVAATVALTELGETDSVLQLNYVCSRRM